MELHITRPLGPLKQRATMSPLRCKQQRSSANVMETVSVPVLLLPVEYIPPDANHSIEQRWAIFIPEGPR